MIYLYAFADPLPAAALGAGVDDAPVEATCVDGVAVVHSVHDRVDAAPTPERLWRHEEVVERLLPHGAVLPVRFGTTVVSAEAARRFVQANHRRLAAALDGVRGRVELGVRVLWEPPVLATTAAGPAPSCSPGRAYLLARQDEERRHDAVREAANARAAEIHDRLDAAAERSTFDVLRSPRLLLSGAYLLGAAGVDRFREVAAEVGRSHPDVDVLCTGPWPAHHFAPRLEGASTHG